MKHRLRFSFLVAPLLVAALLAGCGKKHDDDHDHDHAGHDDHGHSHEARHGGVAVVLGEEEFHVEFTHSDRPGVLQAYVFDGHMENYIRITAPAFPAVAEFGGVKAPVTFLAVANPASGETVGDTALFEAVVPGLTSQQVVALTVPALQVKGNAYQNLSATIPSR
jgi:hypothetical protein